MPITYSDSCLQSFEVALRERDRIYLIRSPRKTPRASLNYVGPKTTRPTVPVKYFPPSTHALSLSLSLSLLLARSLLFSYARVQV